MGCCCGQRVGGKVGSDREKNSIRARPEKLLGFWPRPRNHQQRVRPVILGLHDITINIGQNYLREHYPSDKTKQQTKSIYWITLPSLALHCNHQNTETLVPLTKSFLGEYILVIVHLDETKNLQICLVLSLDSKLGVNIDKQYYVLTGLEWINKQ